MARRRGGGWPSTLAGCLAAACLAIASGYVVAAPAGGEGWHEVETRDGWHLLCAGASPSRDACTVATNVKDADGGPHWARVAVGLPRAGRPATLDLWVPPGTPRKDGVSISASGRQLGKVFLDACDDAECTSHVVLDDRFLEDLAEAGDIAFEYQVDATSDVRIPVDASGLRYFMDGANRRK